MEGADEAPDAAQESRSNKRNDEGDSSDEEAVGGDEADAAENRLNKRHKDDGAEYEGEAEEMENKAEVGIQDGDDIGYQDDLADEEHDSEKEDDDEEMTEKKIDVNELRDRIEVLFYFYINSFI